MTARIAVYSQIQRQLSDRADRFPQGPAPARTRTAPRAGAGCARGPARTAPVRCWPMTQQGRGRLPASTLGVTEPRRNTPGAQAGAAAGRGPRVRADARVGHTPGHRRPAGRALQTTDWTPHSLNSPAERPELTGQLREAEDTGSCPAARPSPGHGPPLQSERGHGPVSLQPEGRHSRRARAALSGRQPWPRSATTGACDAVAGSPCPAGSRR